MAADVLFECTWGDIRLFVSEISWQAGQTQVIHDLAAGNIHPVQPRGDRLHTARVQLIFDEFDGQDVTGAQAWRAFQASSNERRIFTHPMEGSFYARVGDLDAKLDQDSVITATCEFIPDGIVQPVSPSGAGISAVTAEGSVGAAMDDLLEVMRPSGLAFPDGKSDKFDFTKPVAFNINQSFSLDVDANVSVDVSGSANVSVSGSATGEVSASVTAAATASVMAFATVYAAAIAEAAVTAVVEISASVSADAFAFSYATAALDADCRASVQSWDEEGTTIREIGIDSSRISDSIATMIDTGGFENDVQFWPAYRAAIMLGEAVRSAAISATSDTPTVFVMRVQDTTALLPLAARIYGGFDAQERALQIASLNDIRTPGWLDPGDYLMPSRPPGSTSPILGA
jgi:hypothetical protein